MFLRLHSGASVVVQSSRAGINRDGIAVSTERVQESKTPLAF